MHIQFAELPVSDQERAKRFYVEKLGCEVAADAPMGEDGWRWIELKFPGAETTLHFHRRKDDRPSDEPVLVLVADDVKAAVADLKTKGVEIITEPHGGAVAAGADRRRVSRQRRQPHGDRQPVTGTPPPLGPESREN